MYTIALTLPEETPAVWSCEWKSAVCWCGRHNPDTWYPPGGFRALGTVQKNKTRGFLLTCQCLCHSRVWCHKPPDVFSSQGCNFKHLPHLVEWVNISENLPYDQREEKEQQRIIWHRYTSQDVEARQICSFSLKSSEINLSECCTNSVWTLIPVSSSF